MSTAVMLLWHMHQPFYKDLAEGAYAMPWVRLHALKDYYGMVAILRDFPSVHVTFNLVPSLLVQLEEYARDEAREESFRIAFKLADTLTREEREDLLTFAFQLNRENLLNRYPRFRELYDKAVASHDRSVAARLFTSQDFLDLQVLSQLAWFDELYLASDPVVSELVRKGREYSEEEKSSLRNKETEIFKVTLEEYRKAAERGQIEISTSPFYHPILPLIADSATAGESHPGVKLPRRPFRHPEDARAQLRAARDFHERIFGHRPAGLWPSEGSVSDEVMRLAAEEGFKWAATDEGVLARSLQTAFYRQPDGTVTSGGELYRPHRFSSGDRSISIFFRDHQLSDLIGFVYSRMDARTAAADLHQRVRAAARSTGSQPAVISIILDGENAWEFFPGNGREFLKNFYGRLASDPDLCAVTATEALALAAPGSLSHVVPGSWVNSTFDIWIGAEEDNRAWDLLNDARDFFAAHSASPQAPREKAQLAEQEVWIAEGSDWCWWYGPEHSSAHDEEFDLLYRKHLSNIYRLLGASPPDELAVPIKRPKARARVVPPTGRIEPQVDGEVTNYFEWLGAGVYTPEYHAGSMHGAAEYFEALYYGYSHHALYLRLDLRPGFTKEHEDFEIRVSIDGRSRARLHAPVIQGALGPVEFWIGEVKFETGLIEGKVQAALGRIFELSLNYELAGLKPQEQAEIQVSLWVNELPVQVIPQEGWLPLHLTEEFVAW